MKTTSGQDALTTRPESETRIAKVKGRAICPKGHRAPRVQYLADEEMFCCTTCATTWKASFEVTIPAGMSCEDWVRMSSAAPDMKEALRRVIDSPWEPDKWRREVELAFAKAERGQ